MNTNIDKALYFIVRSTATTDQQTMQLMRGFYLHIPSMVNTLQFFTWVKANASMIDRLGQIGVNND